MATIEEQIQEIEDEIFHTQKNKATEHHIGKLKAKIARLRDQLEKQARSKGGGGEGYSVRKSGNATVAFVGFPSVGKSTLLNRLTNADSEIGAYEFTTLSIIPGLMEYKDAKIQILDMPGLIEGAAHGKGRGKEVISAARSADLLMLILDVYSPHVDIIIRELYNSGIRVNTHPADIQIIPKIKGGINVNTTVTMTKMDEDMVKSILSGYGIINADVVIREDVDMDGLLDVITGNKIYTRAFVVMNKIDLASPELVERKLKEVKDFKVVPVSAQTWKGIQTLKDVIYDQLDFIRLYLKPQGEDADLEEPMVVKSGSSVEEVCNIIHRDFVKNFRYARVWGDSAKFPGQTVGIDHVLEDKDILSIIIKR